MKVSATTMPPAHSRPTDPRAIVSDWVTRFADEERSREQAQSRNARAVAVRADAVREHMHDLMDSLRDRVARDVDAFARHLPDRAVTIEDNPPGTGFIVRRGRYPEARLTVEPHPETGTIRLQYVFASANGTSMPRMREISVGGDTMADLHFVDVDDRTSWCTLTELSEYLLVPVFSGLPPH